MIPDQMSQGLASGPEPALDDSTSLDRRIYIVDDDEALRRTLRRILTEAGIHTQEFGSAEAFLEAYRALPLGCVLLDLRLPGMDGVELISRLREMPVRSPVVMLSGHGDIPSAVRAVKAGAFEFLQKPFRKEDLLRVVDHAFGIVESMLAAGAGSLASLTPRETQVLTAFSDGASNKVVAKRLGLSPRTVEMHRAQIMKKLSVDNLTQALFLVRDADRLA